MKGIVKTVELSLKLHKTKKYLTAPLFEIGYFQTNWLQTISTKIECQLFWGEPMLYGDGAVLLKPALWNLEYILPFIYPKFFSSLFSPFEKLKIFRTTLFQNN